MSEPCFYCGTNSWTDCKHRKAQRQEPALEVDDKPKKDWTGQGHNFRNKRGNNTKKYWSIEHE